MEPSSESPKPTIDTAREVGRARIDKFLNWVAPVMAPDVLVEVGKNAAQDKVAEVKDKLENFADRVSFRAAEIKDRFVEKAKNTRDRTVERYEKLRDRTVYRAKELGKRAIVLGVTPVWDLGKLAYKIPASLETRSAGKDEGRITMQDLRSKKSKEEYRAQLKMLKEQHKRELESIKISREGLTLTARQHRENVKKYNEKGNNFLGIRSLVERLKPSA